LSGYEKEDNLDNERDEEEVLSMLAEDVMRI
jgi:hypothetical protein